MVAAPLLPATWGPNLATIPQPARSRLVPTCVGSSGYRRVLYPPQDGGPLDAPLLATAGAPWARRALGDRLGLARPQLPRALTGRGQHACTLHALYTGVASSTRYFVFCRRVIDMRRSRRQPAAAATHARRGGTRSATTTPSPVSQTRMRRWKETRKGLAPLDRGWVRACSAYITRAKLVRALCAKHTPKALV